MKRISLSRYPILVGAVVAMALAIVLDKVFDVFVNGENSSHAAGHLTYAVPALLFAFSLIRLDPPPKPTESGRRSRRALTAGLLLLGIGGATEAIGAFGKGTYNSGFNALTALHDLGLLLTLAGTFAIFMSALLFLLSFRASKTPRPIIHLICVALILFFVIR
jgi:hypothetical protein